MLLVVVVTEVVLATAAIVDDEVADAQVLVLEEQMHSTSQRSSTRVVLSIRKFQATTTGRGLPL